MTINHLLTCDGSVRCSGCGHVFEVPGFVLSDPIRLVEVKEQIAEKHVCCGPRNLKAPVRVLRNSEPAPTDEYFLSAMRREMRA